MGALSLGMYVIIDTFYNLEMASYKKLSAALRKKAALESIGCKGLEIRFV